MKEKIKLYGSILIILIFVPYLITMYLQGGGLFSFPSAENRDAEEQLVGILAKEIPVTYETECLKAQAVIARTNLYRMADETETSAASEQSEAEGLTRAEMKANWGEHYEQYLEKIEHAVAQTKGEIITYQGKPIQAAYHAASNKHTRSASQVPGQEAYAYLTGVDSSEDIEAEHFLYIGYMEKQKFADSIQSLFQGEKIDAGQLPEALQITQRDSEDYVTKVTYGKTVVNGEALRQALGLNSACFYFSELDGRIRIVTKGVGHGLGFSQYGGNQLAKKGYKYREILKYYYKEIEIERE